MRSQQPNCLFKDRRAHRLLAAAALAALAAPAMAQQRILGVDISYWNGVASQSNWNTGFSSGNRKFAFIRASRGGTTGLDQPQGTPGGGSQSTLSRRYDDPNFVQNINRATAAGMYAGPYHYGRHDIIETTPGANGIANTGQDEADHFIQMAGAWMRPGYMIPVFDLEGDQTRTNSQIAQFCLDFSNRIYEVMGIRPAMYINGVYSSALQSATASQRNQLAQPAGNSPSVVSPAYPMLWDARYAYQGDESAPGIQTANPKDTASTFYGPWDDYGTAHPWNFWQYSSTSSIPGFNAVDGTIDANVAHGDIEYVRNFLVPAVWLNNSSGDWSTLANWNSGQTAIAPATGAGQATPLATGPLPTPRLPGAAGSGPTSGQFDTVILERPGANITVTLSTGTHNVRKLYLRETLNITGGTLNINYDPTYRADTSTTVLHGGPISAQLSGNATLSGSGALSVHTLLVDATRSLSLNGGTLTFNKINLTRGTTPAKIIIGGDAIIAPLNNATATVANSGSGTSASVDLLGGTRVLTVNNGSAAIDVDFQVPVTNGGITKTGLGTLQLSSANTYTGATIINAGALNLTGSTASGSFVTINAGGTLSGSGVVNGNAALNGTGIINYSSGGSIQGTLTVNGGAWDGVGTVVGTVTSQSGTFTIGSGANLTANAILNVTGGALAAADANSTITGSVNYSSGSNSTWAGVIAGLAKGLTVSNAAATLTLTGANTYTGATNVNLGTLLLTASNNLSNTSGVVTTMTGSTGGSVRLSNGISINRPLSIGGAGVNGGSGVAPGSIGALDNLSGNNTWAGNITLHGTGTTGGSALLNQIGSSAGTLLLSGIIQNGAGSSWAKTGDGDVVIAPGAANTYTNLTRVLGGRLILERDGALGTANDPSTNADGNTFQLAGSSSTIAFRSTTSLNYTVKEWINLEGNGAPGFGQLDNLGGDNTFAGHVGLAGPANVSTIGVTSGSLNLAGGIWARGASGARTLNKLGPGVLIVSGDSSGLPSNIINNGAIALGTVNVNSGVLETRSPGATSTNLPGMSTWNVAAGATLRIGSGILATDNVTVASGGLLELPAAGGGKVLRATNITPNGKIDLADHKMIVDYTLISPIGDWNGTAYDGLTKHILDGRNGGTWDGNGIITSMADAQGANNMKATIGITEAWRALGLDIGETGSWRGQSVDATTVLIAYAYQGDADLSGVIDSDDFFHIDSAINTPGASGFGRGDFNFDGRIDADDYFLINMNYGRQYAPLSGGAPAGVSSVPEPSNALAAGALAASLLRRRRRQ